MFQDPSSSFLHYQKKKKNLTFFLLQTNKDPGGRHVLRIFLLETSRDTPVPIYKLLPCKCAKCLLIQLGCHTNPSNRATGELPSGLYELQLCSAAMGLQGTPVCARLDPEHYGKQRQHSLRGQSKLGTRLVSPNESSDVLSFSPLCSFFNMLILLLYVCAHVHASTNVMDRCNTSLSDVLL